MQIQTVTGPVPLDQLGRTLMHEHLFIAFPGAAFDPLAAFDRAAFIAEAVKRLTELREVHGVRTFVDPCPIELGRDPAMMADTGVAFVGVFREISLKVELGHVARIGQPAVTDFGRRGEIGRPAHDVKSP